MNNNYPKWHFPMCLREFGAPHQGVVHLTPLGIFENPAQVLPELLSKLQIHFFQGFQVKCIFQIYDS